jgi:hypothetical protein
MRCEGAEDVGLVIVISVCRCGWESNPSKESVHDSFGCKGQGRQIPEAIRRLADGFWKAVVARGA